MLGMSVYLSENLENISVFLDKIIENDIKTIFTSLHIPEYDSKNALSKMEFISNKIKNRNIDLIVDISINTLNIFDLNIEEMILLLKSYGIKNVRVDYGFSIKDIKNISGHFNIILNASTIDDKYCDSLKNEGINLENLTVCHNFYPRPETGLSDKFFIKKNNYFRAKGFKIQVFIPGENKRGPIFEGLPTLEKHRKYSPFEAYLDFVKNYDIDQIFVGDVGLSDNSIKRILKFENENLIELKLEFLIKPDNYLDKIFWDVHQNRLDYSELVVRSTKSREEIREKISPQNTIERIAGSITIDNEKYLRYNGEIQITIVDLNKDDRVNVIGKIVDEDVKLLKYIIDDVKFRFIN